jgi:hypothetical protein
MASNYCNDGYFQGDINLSIDVFKKIRCIKEADIAECNDIMDDIEILDLEEFRLFGGSSESA